MSDSAARSEVNVPSFAHFLPEFIKELDRVSDAYLDVYDEHKAFIYMVAELFETTEEGFFFSDGPGDGGIDFFIQDSPLYSIYQSKGPDLEAILKLGADEEPSSTKFGTDALKDIDLALQMLMDEEGEYSVKDSIKQLRSDYQRDYKADEEATDLTAVIAIFGELTGPARSAFDSRRNSLSEKGYSLRLIEWQDIYRALHALDSPEDVDVALDLNFEDRDKDILAHRDYCYVLAYAYDFYQAFRDHEWNLFDWNVRLQIPNSPINKRIISSLKTRKGRKIFHHLNNGLLITCRLYEGINRANNSLTVKGAQIINGCQTVRAIFEAYEDLTPTEQEEFRRDARVQVKVIRTIDPDFIGQLVISTNDQNPMKPRNLKSNTAEQRDIQNQFRSLPVKWFYERKDGEWKSLSTISSRIRWFRKSDYEVGGSRGRRTYRRIDNEKLAKAWYPFIGYSNQSLLGRVHYFKDDLEWGVYRRVFRSIPSGDFWIAFRDSSFTANEDLLEQGVPSVYQYLVAYGIAEYVDKRKISSGANRRSAIQRGIENGDLEGDGDDGRLASLPQEVNEFLANDVDYNVNRMILNMRDVIIELFSFILCQRYMACDVATCHKILELPQESMYFARNFDESLLSREQDGNTLFGPIYEFIKDCATQCVRQSKKYIVRRSKVQAFASSI